MNLTRVLQGAPTTLSEAFYEDGLVVDPGVVTIKIEREDGTILIAAGAATTGAGAAARTFNLTAANLTALDILKATWTSPTKGDRIAYVEVVGGYLFSVSDARGLSPMQDTAKYPTADILAIRTLAEMALEHACGVAFVPRYNREKIDGDGSTELLLDKPRPLSVASASVDGSALITTDLITYRDGRVYYANGWARGRQNVEIKYTHGYAVPPPRVGLAALKVAKRFLVDSSISDRATSTITPEGIQFLVTAGVRDAVFDIPEANICVELYGQSFGIG